MQSPQPKFVVVEQAKSWPSKVEDVFGPYASYTEASMACERLQDAHPITSFNVRVLSSIKG